MRKKEDIFEFVICINKRVDVSERQPQALQVRTLAAGDESPPGIELDTLAWFNTCDCKWVTAVYWGREKQILKIKVVVKYLIKKVIQSKYLF